MIELFSIGILLLGAAAFVVAVSGLTIRIRKD